jgi:hypothetical protein
MPGLGAERPVADPVGRMCFALKRAEAPIIQKPVERLINLEVSVQVDATMLVDSYEPRDVRDH